MIIGIVGRKRSGKDTIGDYLINNYGLTKYSFANPLKMGVKELFGFTDEQVFGNDKDIIDPIWGVTPRDVLQIIGTEFCQFDIIKYLPNLQVGDRLFWVKRFELWFNQNKNLNVVICDVRFQHEVDSIKSKGGKIIRVNRDSLTNSDNHKSELEMDLITGVDYVIENNGTLEDLYNNLDLNITPHLF